MMPAHLPELPYLSLRVQRSKLNGECKGKVLSTPLFFRCLGSDARFGIGLKPRGLGFNPGQASYVNGRCSLMTLVVDTRINQKINTY